MSPKNPKLFLSAAGMASLCYFLLLQLMAAHFFPVLARQPIPGIDPIPRAVDPAQYKDGRMPPAAENPAQTEAKKKPDAPKTQTEPRSQTADAGPAYVKPQSAGPVITNLKAEPDPVKRYSTRITWTEDPSNDTVIYIVRDARPISDTDRLFKATNITRPPVSPKKGFFIDEDMPEGTYYYAAVTAFEASREETLRMIPGANYTVNPVIIDRSPDQSVRQSADNPVSASPPRNSVDSIIAQDVAGGVRISWRPVSGAENAVYRVYRSEYPLNNESGYSRAMKIGEITGRETFIIDSNPPAGEVYYGVTFAESYSAPEHRELVYQKSFINHTRRPVQEGKDSVKNADENESGSIRVNGIIAVNSDRSVKISWIPPEKTGIFYTVYRIVRTGADDTLEKGERLGFVADSASTFEDVNPLENQEVFYAVTVTDRKTGREYKNLEYRQSFINHTFIRKSETASSRKQNERSLIPESLMTYQQDARTVQLLWVDPEGPVSRLGVYRLDRPISSAEVLRYAQRLATVGRNVNQYTDKDLGPGRYFYGLFPLDEAGNPLLIFEEGRTFTGFAVSIREKEGKSDLTSLQPAEQEDAADHKQQMTADKTQEELTKLRLEREALERERREFTEWRRRQEQESRTADSAAGKERQSSGKNHAQDYVYDSNDSIISKSSEKNALMRRRLNEVLSGTYFQGRYGEAIRQLGIFLKQEKTDPENRGRAGLYLGLSLFNLKRYAEAAELFRSDEVMRYYPDRSAFWLQRIAEIQMQN